jgi:tRNA threonylcarbamoyladenosine modification (KEOPS) complex  Pcc1 subunit
MSNNNLFSIESTIEFKFDSSKIRDISYNSFLPEFKKLQTKRSQICMEKKNENNIIFDIKSNDITAFRASINEIISFGKVITNSLKIVESS